MSNNEYAPPPGPPPGRTSRSNNPFHNQSPSGDRDQSHTNQPPPQYQPQSNNPFRHATQSASSTTPSQPNADSNTTNDDAPPPYHDWTVIPDTALLPPPPTITHDFSSGYNASKDDFNLAQRWCASNPLFAPQTLQPAQLAAIANVAHRLVPPPHFQGRIEPHHTERGRFWVATARGARDSCVHPALPVYVARCDSPLVTERAVTLYFEVQILRMGGAPGSQPAPQQLQHPVPAGPVVEQHSGRRERLFSRFLRGEKNERQPQQQQQQHISSSSGGWRLASRVMQQGNGDDEAGVAIGFFAPPYPPFRLPGWERASLGVHSDDGRRYVYDPHGGIDFIEGGFGAGERVGIGMRMKVGERASKGECNVQCFFTRGGVEVGKWDLWEERDLELEPLEGLAGERDVFPAVGVFGGVEVEVILGREGWLYRP